MTVASYLLYLVAALERSPRCSHLTTVGTSDAINASVRGHRRRRRRERHRAVFLIIGAVMNILFAGGLATLGIFDGRGKNVARIITWVVGGISLCCIGSACSATRRPAG